VKEKAQISKFCSKSLKII